MFERVRARRIFEEVVSQIREQIVSGNLKPGDKLPAERDLAAQLHVSRNAVREAMRVLEITGTIQLKTGVQGGAFISEIDPTVIAATIQDMLYLGSITADQLTEARIWIESAVTRVVCETGTAEDFKRLEENVAASQQAMRTGRIADRIELNIEFHNILARATNNPVLILNIEMLMDIMRFFARQIDPGDGKDIMASRKRLMKHLWARDADAAVAEMTAILTQVSKRYAKLAMSEEAVTAAQAATTLRN